MAQLRADAVATRSVLLELQDERRFTQEGHTFLDQKRMLLAGEMLRWLQRYADARRAYQAAHSAARHALAHAVARHGTRELAALPPRSASLAAMRYHQDSFLGVCLQRAEGELDVSAPTAIACNPSPECRGATDAFERLLRTELTLALANGNLERLLQEYRRTERRARALENVVLPELSATIDHIDEQLAEQEHEEAARMRLRRD